MGRRRLPRHASREAQAEFDRADPERERERKMIRRLVPLVIAWIVVVAIVAPLPGDAQQAASPDPAFLKQYCITCHNQQLKTAGLTLDTLDVAHVGPDA